jgi:hypothetical protein
VEGVVLSLFVYAFQDNYNGATLKTQEKKRADFHGTL